MRLEFSESDIRKLVETVAATLIPKLIEQLKRPDQPIWKHHELAKALGVTGRTLSTYRDEEKIVGSKIGKSWVYSRQAVLEFLSRTQVT